jgi:uncharacterized protein YcfL
MRGITKIATSVAVLLHLLVGCSSHSGTATTRSTVEQPSARRLTDLTDASSVQAVRAAFNAHAGEARFLALLSPT